LTSSGTAPLIISTGSLTGTGFTGHPDSGATFPITLQPNQSMTLQMQFVPSTAGAASGKLTVISNSATGGTTQIQLSGTGAVTTSSMLTVSTNSLAFGNIALKSTTTLPLTLTSSGTAPLTIKAMSFTGAGFTRSNASLPMTLNPHQSVTLQVQFSPAAAGGTTGQLMIASDSSSGATTAIQLSGTGTSATAPKLMFSTTALSFGNVPIGSTGTLSLMMISSGTAPVTVSAATLTGAGFSASGVTFPVTLSPNQSVTLQVQFDPTRAAAAVGQVTIKSDSATGSTTQISLNGTSTAMQHSIDLNWNAPSNSPDPVASYNVYRSTNGGATLTKLDSTPDGQTDYTDTAVQSGATYNYAVKSVDASGVESAASNQIILAIP
ncbi:MAG TPA: choice-of-anchor D domain-containing protein, partial [Edaphobacter sp.]|nr:choice-of-anchor D domain-containing protein [Edaphobacter sp.]